MKRRREPILSTMLTGLYTYIYCMMFSAALTGMPIYGGALYMCGQVATVFAQTFGRDAVLYLPRPLRPWRWVLLVALLLMNAFVLVFYPMSLDSPQIWILFSLVITMLVRDSACQQLIRLSVAGRVPETRLIALVTSGHLAALLVMGVILLYNVPAPVAWPLLGGYLLCSLCSCYELFKNRELARQLTLVPPTQAEQTRETVRQANAYKVFERLSMIVLAGMEMTLIVMYTFLAATAEQLLIRMALALLTTLACREAAEAILRFRQRRGHADPFNLLLLGLSLWLYGLWVFSRMLGTRQPELAMTYVCLGLCAGGCALSDACLQQMETNMAAVARFTAKGSIAGYQQIRAVARVLSSLLGRMLALAALTALCLATGDSVPHSVAELSARFQPLMVLPALLTVLAGLLCVLKFPLSSRYTHKLLRFLHIRENGGENPALEKQLESVVIARHTQPLFIRTLMALVRPFFRHTLKGAENIHPDESNPIVFLCNHGEIYGPVAGMLFCPVPVRPWVISDIALDPEEVAAYLYRYTFSKIPWLGPLQKSIPRFIGPLSVCVMNQLECVPVFRHKPRELMTTFRKSVEAMQAGDNLLIYPENPDANPNRPGYEHGRPGELFRGFTMLAQLYYSRTGKACRFVPMLAHKGLRTISFGTEIVYNPENDPISERDRVVEAAYSQMQALFNREEALYQQKQRKNGKQRGMNADL